MGIPFFSCRTLISDLAIVAVLVVRAVLILAGIYLAFCAYGYVIRSIDYYAPMGGPICHDGRCGGR